MDGFVKDLRTVFASLVQRFGPFFTDYNSRAFQVTGILGLAAVLYSLYRIKDPSKRSRDSINRQGESRAVSQINQSPTAGPSNNTDRSRQQASDGASGKGLSVQESKPRSLAWAVKSRLSGVQAVTICAPGVLLQESTVQELEESATVKDEVIEVLREMAQHTSLYIITQVAGDTGEATCRGALESVGLVGTQKGQIPPQRLLFCSTLDGKGSIVRQLEPQLHVDSHAKTVEDLKRFIRLVHICPSDQPAAGGGSANVSSAPSLAQIFV